MMADSANSRGGGRGRSDRRWNNRRGRGGGRGRGFGRGRNQRQGGGGRNQDRRLTDDPVHEIGKPSSTALSIAIEGCCHGDLDLIYQRVLAHGEKTGKKIDLLLCCGDFQSLRNTGDFHSSSIPPKYRSLGIFHKYYAGELVAPILTIFIGGNHEASQPLRELYYGGWVAPNIYYLGAAGVVRYGGLRIGGMSGIFKSHDYRMGHYERPPFDRSTLRSVYHTRNVDIYRMKCLAKGMTSMDIVLSHDWPLGIEQHGNTKELLRQKPYFRSEVERNCLGSPPNREVLDLIRPKWWFSAHLHVKFSASVQHATNESSALPEREAIQLVPSQVSPPPGGSDGKTSRKTDEPDCVDNVPHAPTTEFDEAHKTSFHALESSSAQCHYQDLTTQMTQFLALDKCLPRRQYISVLHIEPKLPYLKGSCQLEYDPEWLAVLRKTHELTSTERRVVHVPEDLADLSSTEIEWVEGKLKEVGSVCIPENFQATVPTTKDPLFRGDCPPFPIMGNPQTDQLLEILGLDHILTVPYDRDWSPARISQDLRCGVSAVAAFDGQNEIHIDGVAGEELRQRPRTPGVHAVNVADENEILLGEEGDLDAANTLDENEIQLEDEADLDVANTLDGNEIQLEDDVDLDAANTVDENVIQLKEEGDLVQANSLMEGSSNLSENKAKKARI